MPSKAILNPGQYLLAKYGFSLKFSLVYSSGMAGHFDCGYKQNL
jgi:hypothetical protein